MAVDAVPTGHSGLTMTNKAFRNPRFILVAGVFCIACRLIFGSVSCGLVFYRVFLIAVDVI